jgi:hypothetical protein
MVARFRVVSFVGLAAVAALGSGCVGSESNSSTDASAGSSGNPFVGTFTATYAGVYTITSPEVQPQASNTETGTFVITAPTTSTLDVTATFMGPNGVSGTCTATADRNGDTASSDPATQACSYTLTGATQTNTGSSSFSVSGNTVVDALTGSFTGMNASGSYAGTYSGTWTLTPQ